MRVTNIFLVVGEVRTTCTLFGLVRSLHPVVVFLFHLFCWRGAFPVQFVRRNSTIPNSNGSPAPGAGAH